MVVMAGVIHVDGGSSGGEAVVVMAMVLSS